MAHIHTEPGQHDLTVGGYIVRLDQDEPAIMLHRHLKLNMIMQFGGHVELNEHPWETIARELREEVGYDLDQLAVLQPHDRMTSLSMPILLLPYPLCVLNATYGNIMPGHFHDDISWAFTTKESPRYAPAAGESRDIVLVSRTELQTAPERDIPEDVREIMHFIFDTCLPKWEAVPALPIVRSTE